ncbi:MAG: LytR family transcriptional regulator [Actinobacteria bacterium]|uniref:Unannotated protein n=1 Tax=freshwater metagenome TaxID=449393 RepID=A0A6J6S6W6_9ZZZZ|nr:LytR family transcriptional regulator [Actinomycetota bacterium]
MAERPDDGDREAGSGPEFGWLYGGQQATPPPTHEPGPDATRMMRTQPRDLPGAVPPPGTAPVPTPAPGAPPPYSPAPGGGGVPLPRPRRPRFRVRYVLLLVLLWIVYLVAVPVFAWTKVDKVAFEPGGDRPGEQPGTTYLVVGSDSRGDLTAAERKAYGTGNASGQRTDTILVLHTGSGPNLLMSIPRDTLVDVPGHGTTKINAAYAFGGPKLLVKTVEQTTGIRIDEYVEIGIGGFVDLVDAVGGVEICPKQDMVDKLANLDVKKGCQEADGVTALGYARSRHVAALGDIERTRQQREVVSAIGRSAVSPWSVLNPVRWWRLNMASVRTVTVGDGMSPLRAGLWAMAMTRVDGDTGLTCVVPISDLAVHLDEARAKQMFQAVIEDRTDRIGKSLCTPTGLPKAITG